MGYSIDQSPFYKLTSINRLAELLHCEKRHLVELAQRADNYRVFPTKTGRLIQNPKDELKRIQKRITKLLTRMEYPGYLGSALKGRSYRTNAERHLNNLRVVKTDIKRFFPHVKDETVFQLFRRDFKCVPDVADTLKKLLTHKGALATGSPASPIISYLANKNMFDGIEHLAAELGIKTSLYIDDLTFSGENANRRFLNKIKAIISSYGYESHKDAAYRGKQVKIITGVAINGKQCLLPNQRHKRIKESRDKLVEYDRKKAIKGHRIALLKKLIGQLEEASQFDINNSFKVQCSTYRAELNSLTSKG